MSLLFQLPVFESIIKNLSRKDTNAFILTCKTIYNLSFTRCNFCGESKNGFFCECLDNMEIHQRFRICKECHSKLTNFTNILSVQHTKCYVKNCEQKTILFNRCYYHQICHCGNCATWENKYSFRINGYYPYILCEDCMENFHEEEDDDVVNRFSLINYGQCSECKLLYQNWYTIDCCPPQEIIGKIGDVYRIYNKNHWRSNKEPTILYEEYWKKILTCKKCHDTLYHNVPN